MMQTAKNNAGELMPVRVVAPPLLLIGAATEWDRRKGRPNLPTSCTSSQNRV